jgi:capsular polysaccharide export protein
MVSSAASISLVEQGDLLRSEAVSASSDPVSAQAHHQFLRIPPFPEVKIFRFAERPGSEADPRVVVDAMRRLRVGGAYWAAQAALPSDAVVVRSFGAFDAAKRLWAERPVILYDPAGKADVGSPACAIIGERDPWSMLTHASAVVPEDDDELRLVAALLSVPCYEFEAHSGELNPSTADVINMVRDSLCRTTFENPFSGDAMTPLETVELCGFWRRLIDSNRNFAGGVGFAFWKQKHVAPLLWNGSGQFQFLRSADRVSTDRAIAVWRSKAPLAVAGELQRRNIPIVEVEDGFLRSRGLGADCVPPLSITVDRLGAHFDPSGPSELEVLLEQGGFDRPLIERARKLRRVIVDAGIGKYERGITVLDRPAGNRRHILVPGQVEDDRAVQIGGCGLVSNVELLARVRENAPDAYILYKPHPDVVAGHRRGAIADVNSLRFADEIVGELPIASLIAMVDEVHVNTSLAGFEALMRDKKVTTYGVPFYAGWGLTTDLGPVPNRRTARRTIDELVAATLLLYPRYFDPVTGLPCPAEVVAARLCCSEESHDGFFIGMRRLQGKLMRRLRSLVQ